MSKCYNFSERRVLQSLHELLRGGMSGVVSVVSPLRDRINRGERGARAAGGCRHTGERDCRLESSAGDSEESGSSTQPSGQLL